MTDWLEHALCRGAPTDWWFQPSAGASTYKAAKAVCERCPVRDECLVDAMKFEKQVGNYARHGLFGGLNPKERRKLAKRLCLIEEVAA